ncbi:MAG TPA: hypothetical protein VN446_09705, partial [Candidatus Acidoferrum sp.]|nr:hypothetical protein [Candidatus Acidoferrum sp.]
NKLRRQYRLVNYVKKIWLIKSDRLSRVRKRDENARVHGYLITTRKRHKSDRPVAATCPDGQREK